MGQKRSIKTALKTGTLKHKINWRERARASAHTGALYNNSYVFTQQLQPPQPGIVFGPCSDLNKTKVYPYNCNFKHRTTEQI